MEPVYGNMKPLRSLSPAEPRTSERSHLRAAVGVLGLLSAGLLIGLVVVGTNYHRSVRRVAELTALRANLTVERDAFKASLLLKTRELEIMAGPCPSGWRRFGCSCYLLSDVTGSWEEGRRHCAGHNATLAVVESPGEQRFLSDYTTTRTFVWIGLTDRETEGTWTWINGAPLSQSNTYWRPKQPDNGGGDQSLGDENCAHIITGERVMGNWNDLPCNRSIAWFCEKMLFNAENNWESSSGN